MPDMFKMARQLVLPDQPSALLCVVPRLPPTRLNGTHHKRCISPQD